MIRKVIEFTVIVAALIAWFIFNHNAGPAEKYLGAAIILAVIRFVAVSTKPKQP
jgi:hypothetical protein